MANIELLVTDHTELTKHGSIIRSIPENTLTDFRCFWYKDALQFQKFRNIDLQVIIPETK